MKNSEQANASPCTHATRSFRLATLQSGDTPLGDILDKVYAAHEGKKIDVKALAAAKGLKEEFAKIVEDFDRDRVHDNDVKKLFTWYNILVDNGFTKFAEIEEEKEAEKSDAPAEEE